MIIKTKCHRCLHNLNGEEIKDEAYGLLCINCKNEDSMKYERLQIQIIRLNESIVDLNLQLEEEKSKNRYVRNLEKKIDNLIDWIKNKKKNKTKKKSLRLTKKERNLILLKFSNKCALCGYNKKDELVIDHKIPISKGGTNHPDNLQVLCIECNLRKSNHLISIKNRAENEKGL